MPAKGLISHPPHLFRLDGERRGEEAARQGG
jgi:hypothetical protein